MSGVGPVNGAANPGFGHSPYAPPSPAGGSRAGDDRERRRPADWHEALTELEGEVLAAEETLARDRAEEIAAWGRRSTDWVPPSGLGPLPDDLRQRALHLLQHQLAVAEAHVERITQTPPHPDVAARMSYAPDRAVPAFFDKAL
jgi:hypothetical protein